MLEKEESPESQARAENLQELANAAADRDHDQCRNDALPQQRSASPSHCSKQAKNDQRDRQGKDPLTRRGEWVTRV